MVDPCFVAAFSADDQMKNSALQAGANMFLKKPITAHIVLKIMRGERWAIFSKVKEKCPGNKHSSQKNERSQLILYRRRNDTEKRCGYVRGVSK